MTEDQTRLADSTNTPKNAADAPPADSLDLKEYTGKYRYGSASYQKTVERRKSRSIKIGPVLIGGGFPIAVQSMTTTDTRDVEATVRQIESLEAEGCEIVRVSVLNMDAAEKLGEIKKRINIPLVADIHFRYKLALEAIAQGVHKVRLNPGNIGARHKVEAVCSAAKDAGIPIRIGVNSGSLPRDLLIKYGHDDPEAFALAAMRQIEILEDHNFHNIAISVKSTNVNTSYYAYKILATMTDYPFHVGITEAGTSWPGSIKSAAGIGAILMQGLGDTIRVSLATDPVEEVKVGKRILRSLELKHEGVDIIACPTCGRCQIDMIPLAEEVERRTAHFKSPLKAAVMGCVVNGPGEAMAADIGIAGGDGIGLLFKKGKVVGEVKEHELADLLVSEIAKMTGEAVAEDDPLYDILGAPPLTHTTDTPPLTDKSGAPPLTNITGAPRLTENPGAPPLGVGSVGPSSEKGARPLQAGSHPAPETKDPRIHKITSGKNRLEGNTSGRGGVLKSEHPDWLPDSAKK
ncbi:MAG: flavodoxin-dependent (E)-4-hydroxy-3-methylbut-2-enyl-diphosphate synthase [candidate division Zixibacteria bacterium]|nr:flavodoxin-dependent (E)-4-hydroxy-3-methylbut-2-enyl-diphosphate synthase [candidate division Zixibacteria bacterium]